ncbi:hypothetical protein MnTg02_01295 [bacterium MnTg02]|nr:hypothetical protein MnTg02_01295 [bacterium MnTg02]
MVLEFILTNDWRPLGKRDCVVRALGGQACVAIECPPVISNDRW